MHKPFIVKIILVYSFSLVSCMPEKYQRMTLSQHSTEQNNVNEAENLISAIEQEQYQLIEKLIRKGANINAQNEEGATALHIAVANANFPLAQLLINNKANLNTQDNQGLTPLNLARSQNRDAVAQLLQQAQKIQLLRKSR
jgi:ankyrin repeat protein